ncbi:MAG TPA: Hsp70 family protein, partial [Pseudomonadales bacterium]|nr:Hsp70 family protein [Pseudomonadales bacterium]
MIGVGIDFGTSNSAAAWYDGKRVVLVPLEENDDIMPTATHLDRVLRTRTGIEAVRQYIEENRDRIVELTPEVVGRSQLLINDRDIEDPESEAEVASVSVFGQAHVDRGLPGRLFRGVKRLLGNPSIKRLLVFDHPFRLVALITPVLLHIRKSIEKSAPEPLGDVHIGHPVRFEGNEESRNQLALSRLGEACQYAGFGHLSFYPEPVAATLSYLYDEDAPSHGKVLTVDFGGGTLDLSVVEFSGLNFEVLSTAGTALGGDHIDQLIFKELLFPLLGKGEIWSRVKDGRLIENEFPFDEFEDKLLNWAVTYILNQNHYRSKVADCINKGGPAAEKFERLDDLITHNYSYLVFQAIKDAKAQLSTVE